MEANPDNYEQQQLQAIQAWKAKSPSIVSRAAGYALKPVAWAIGKMVPPFAVEGALKGAD